MKKKTETKKSPAKPAEQPKQKQTGGSPGQDVHHNESRANSLDPKAKGMKTKSGR